MLKSILIYNFIPLLAIDVRAQIWADKNMLYAVMYAFGMPRYASHSMIQVLANLETAREVTQKQLLLGSTEANHPLGMRNVYITLEEILFHDGLLSYINLTAEPRPQAQRTTRPTPVEPHRQTDPRIIRHHFNPRIASQIVRGTPRRPGTLAWLISCHLVHKTKGLKACTAAVVLFNNIPQVTVFKEGRLHNESYGINYNNTLSTLWKRSQDCKLSGHLIIHEADSAVQALLNLSNRDHKIIKLQELLISAKITLHLADKNEMNKPLEMIQQTTIPRDQALIRCQWPPAALRKLRNKRVRALQTSQAVRRNSQINKTMAHLCPSAAQWSKVPLD